MRGTPIRRTGVLVLGLLPAAVVAAAWLVLRRDDLSAGREHVIGAVADLAALLGLTGFVVLVTLGTRLAWVERTFGLDRMSRLHRRLGPWVVGLFILHGVGRTVRFSLGHGRSWTWSYLFYLGTGDAGLLVGHLALYLVLIAAGVALLRGKRLPFRVWKPGHLLVYPAVLLGFVHAAVKGWGDLRLFPTDAVYFGLAASALALFGVRAVDRMTRDRRRTWILERVVGETHDTTSLVLARPGDPGPFRFRRAGQFAVIRARSGRGWSEPHPFTISCAPASEVLRFTIKAVGAFSAGVRALPPGTPFLCEGPYGAFYPDFGREKRIVMIAGGVGITPFLSFLRHAARSAPDTGFTLIWANKTHADIIAMDELRALAQPPFLKVVHVLSQEPGGLPESGEAVVYERGRVGAEVLAKHAARSPATYYLCGPSPMQEAVLAALRGALGVRPREVKRELFFF